MTFEEIIAKAAKHRISVDFKLTRSGYTFSASASTPTGDLFSGLTQAPRLTPVAKVVEILEEEVHEMVAAATIARNTAKAKKAANG